MTRPGIKRAFLGGVAATLALVLLFFYRDRRPAESERTANLRLLRDSLRHELEAHLARDPLLSHPEIDGDVVVAIRTLYLGGIIQETTRLYLDRVTLDMKPDIHVSEKGELRKQTLFGNMKLGDWVLELDIARISGTLGARTPDLSVASGNTVRIALPVKLVSGRGQGRVHFAWDSSSLANMVCKDFEIQEDLEATVFPDEYRVRGGFTLVADADQIVARPMFQREKFRVRIDLTPESWARVRAAAAAQDTFGRCGLAIDPDEVLPKLKDLANKGFEFRLPASLFRTMTLPAGLHSEVEVEGHKVEVAIQSQLLRLTPEILWYGASVHGSVLSR